LIFKEQNYRNALVYICQFNVIQTAYNMKKLKDDWYKNSTWNGTIDSKFEDALKRARGNYNKAEYLQIQGSLLLDNAQPNIQAVGVALLSRLLEDFPQEHSSVILAQEKLGDYYLQQNNHQQAIHFFTLVTNYCIEQNSRGGTTTISDLKLAEALFKTNESINLEQAYLLVIKYPVALLKTTTQKFYYAALAARICHILQKKEEATNFANTALALPVVLKPVATNRKPSAANKQMETILKILEEISKQ